MGRGTDGSALAVCVLIVGACASSPKAPSSSTPPPRVVVGVRDVAPTTVQHDENLIVPCGPTTPEALAAKQTLDALSTRVGAIRAPDPPDALAREIEALLATPCFALARDDLDAPLRWSSGLALGRWWSDGGHDWLTSYLTMVPMPDLVIAGTPPTPRKTLTVESVPNDDPLRPLLCPAKAVDDGSCGTETAGWRLRVANITQRVSDSGDRGTYCATRLRSDTSGASPYAVFLACLNGSAGKDVMPLGVFQAPKTGWFIVSHSVFIAMAGCREDVAAYDLATGAAYIVRCFTSSPARLAIGRVPVGALREAAWMSMLQHRNDGAVRTEANWSRVPSGVVIGRRRGEKVPTQRMIIITTSDAPSIDWAWVRGNNSGRDANTTALAGQASGRYDVSTSSLAAHASDLIRIVDAAFEEGCSPALLPRALPWNNLGPIVTDSGVRSDVGTLFNSIDQTKTMFANAPRNNNSTARCAPLP